MDVSRVVQKGAVDAKVNGVLKLVEHCGIPYPRLVRMWKGDDSAKIADLKTVLKSLGLELDVKPISKGG